MFEIKWIFHQVLEFISIFKDKLQILEWVSRTSLPAMLWIKVWFLLLHSLCSLDICFEINLCCSHKIRTAWKLWKVRLRHLEVWSLLCSVLLIITELTYTWAPPPKPQQDNVLVILCCSRSEKPKVTSYSMLKVFYEFWETGEEYSHNHGLSALELGDLSAWFSRGLPMWETGILFASPVSCVSLKWILNYQVHCLGELLDYEATYRNILHFPWPCFVSFDCKVSHLYWCHPSSSVDHK